MQVRRLKHHPSILLWTGNNENEKALQKNWYGSISVGQLSVKWLGLQYGVISIHLANRLSIGLGYCIV